MTDFAMLPLYAGAVPFNTRGLNYSRTDVALLGRDDSVWWSKGAGDASTVRHGAVARRGSGR